MCNIVVYSCTEDDFTKWKYNEHFLFIDNVHWLIDTPYIDRLFLTKNELDKFPVGLKHLTFEQFFGDEKHYTFFTYNTTPKGEDIVIFGYHS